LLNRAHPGRILIVRLGAMGDIVHALPAAASLKRAYPRSQITWVVERRWAALLEENPCVDRVVLLDRTFAGLMRLWRELRQERFDFAIDFQGLVKSAVAASVARTDRIYGYDRSFAREPLAATFYSDKVAARSVHRVDCNLELASAAGAPIGAYSAPLPPGHREGSLPAGPFVLASPLSGWRAKQWPLAYYARLAERLRHEAGVPLVLNGPPSGRDALAGVPDAILHLSSIEGLLDATRRAAAVVGVDSGPLHVAAALARPGVAIFGPTDPAQTGPYGGTFTVLRDPGAVTSYQRRGEIDASMRAISADAVFDALLPQLARRTHPADCLA
jgi:heptosyltransferase-1